MTIQEAAKMVIQVGVIANGGDFFVLDMGQQIKIMDLARDFIVFSGYDKKDIAIEIVGIRPVEKLHEELVVKEEGVATTRHSRINAVRPIGFDKEEFGDWLQKLAHYTFESYNPKI